MADPRFFQKQKAFTVEELAKLFDCTIEGTKDEKRTLEDLAPLKAAGPSDLSFLDNIKYKEDFKATKAGACFIAPEMLQFAPENVVCLVTRKPYKAYALAAQAFYPEQWPTEQIAPSAVIDPSAKIGKGCRIDPYVVIGAEAEIGDGCWIQPGAVIHAGVKIGKKSKIGANATISHAIIGDYCSLYTGVRIGQDGFGFAIDPTGHVKVPQLGRVIIGDHVEIGANTTIDRGSGPDTTIGDGTWIDNLVQVGHNVVIGRGCIIVSQTGISGSTMLGDFVALGGQVGVAGHLKIGTGARIAAQSGIMRDVPPGEEQMGSPSMPIKKYMRQVATLNNLIKPKKND